MTAVQGASWATPVAFACRCGVVFRASRWRWIDRDVQPDEAERARIEGPVRGNCPRCLEPAHARIEWVELRPSVESATLILGPYQRHELIELLRDHAGAVRERVVGGFEVEEWLLSPTWVFGELDTAPTTKPEVPARSQTPESGPIDQASPNSRPEVVVSDDSEDLSADLEDSDEDTAKRRAPVDEAHTDGVPRPVGSTPWPAPTTVSPARPPESLTYVGALTIDRSTESEDMITLDLELGEAGRGLWGQAALQARPIHLRDHGYPLIGVRLVASYLGRNSVIEGVVDVGSDEAADVFASLSRRFRVMLVLRGEGSSTVHREAAARDLERNAALCLESARASLARREYPRDAYRLALESLGNSSLDDRLRGAAHPLVAGSYRHLIAPRETWLALEALEAASDKANLAQVLEVDGLSVDEYEAIRKRVLVASVEHGLCAPRRFWRRILASGLADDFDGYAAGLARSRAEADQDGDDLDSDQRAAAWARVAELCDIKQLEYPTELRRKLGLGLVSEPSRRRARPVEAAADVPAGDPVRSRSAAGEIRARPGGSDGQGNLRDQLRDPTLRLRVATASLANGSSPEAIDGVFTVIDQFGEDELLAVMPAIAELGTQAVVSLHDKLDSPNQQLRQAAAILLGLTRDPSSIAPLLRRLVREESRIWLDLARAIGALGPSVLERLSAAVRQGVRSDSAVDRTELGNRVARAMAEVVIAGGPAGEARDTLELLAHSLEPEIAVTASRALATLGEVSLAGAEVRGERSLIEVTKLRGFARRAYEAITVPELDLDEEVEAEFV